LKDLDAAAAKFPLSSFDRKTIAEYRGFAYLKLQRLKDAQAAYEAAVATGAYSAEERAKVDRTLFSLAANNADYTQTIALGTNLANANDATAHDLSLIAQAYFVQKDCRMSGFWGDRAIAASRKAGIAPPETVYLFKLQCASDSGSNAAMAAVLYDLIRLTHMRTHWDTLLRLERQDLHNDYNTLQIERLMYDTGAMTLDTDFIELAQLLNDQGIPGEALMVLKTAMVSNHLKPEHRDRAERLLAQLTRRVQTATDILDPDAVRSLLLATASEDGGRTFGAPSAIERTATRSQLERPEELNLYVARVLIVQGDFSGARTALQKFIGLCNPTVAKMWKLYADTLPEPAPATAPANST
jgi:tetratricopeptide (TPR) repeat protein